MTDRIRTKYAVIVNPDGESDITAELKTLEAAGFKVEVVQKRDEIGNSQAFLLADADDFVLLYGTHGNNQLGNFINQLLYDRKSASQLVSIASKRFSEIALLNWSGDIGQVNPVIDGNRSNKSSHDDKGDDIRTLVAEDISDPRSDVRWAAIDTLLELGEIPPSLLPQLTQSIQEEMNSPFPEYREQALEIAFFHLSSIVAPETWTEALQQALHDKNEQLSWSTMTSVTAWIKEQKVQSPAIREGIYERLREFLNDQTDRDNQVRAADLILTLGPEALPLYPAIIAWLNDYYVDRGVFWQQMRRCDLRNSELPAQTIQDSLLVFFPQLSGSDAPATLRYITEVYLAHPDVNVAPEFTAHLRSALSLAAKDEFPLTLALESINLLGKRSGVDAAEVKALLNQRGQNPDQSRRSYYLSFAAIARTGDPDYVNVKQADLLIGCPETDIPYALNALGEMGLNAVFMVPQILTYLNHPRESIRYSAVRALGRIFSADTLNAASPASSQLRFAGECLVRLQIAKKLAGCLSDNSGIVRSYAAIAISRMRELAGPAMPDIFRLLTEKNTSSDQQLAALRVVILLQPHTSDLPVKIMELLRNTPNSEIRCAAAEAVAVLGEIEVIPDLMEMLKGTDREKVVAARALAELRSTNAVPALLDIIETPPDGTRSYSDQRRARVAAGQAVALLGGNSPKEVKERAYAILAKHALGHVLEEERETYRQAIMQIQSGPASENLTMLCFTPEDETEAFQAVAPDKAPVPKEDLAASLLQMKKTLQNPKSTRTEIMGALLFIRTVLPTPESHKSLSATLDEKSAALVREIVQWLIPELEEEVARIIAQEVNLSASSGNPITDDQVWRVIRYKQPYASMPSRYAPIKNANPPTESDGTYRNVMAAVLRSCRDLSLPALEPMAWLGGKSALAWVAEYGSREAVKAQEEIERSAPDAQGPGIKADPPLRTDLAMALREQIDIILYPTSDTQDIMHALGVLANLLPERRALDAESAAVMAGLIGFLNSRIEMETAKIIVREIKKDQEAYATLDDSDPSYARFKIPYDNLPVAYSYYKNSQDLPVFERNYCEAVLKVLAKSQSGALPALTPLDWLGGKSTIAWLAEYGLENAAATEARIQRYATAAK